MASAGAIRAGQAFVEVLAKDLTEKGMNAVELRAKKLGVSIGLIGAKLAGAGAAITLPLLGAAKQFADAGSDLNDMATRTGVSVEALSALGYAAKQSGSDIGAVEIGIKRMQKALVAGSEENVQAAGTFASLGLSIQQLSRLAPEQQFEMIAKRIGAIQDPTARAGAALQVFGKSGTALLPMIQDFDQLTKEAQRFGLVWTTDEAKKADALGDAIDRLSAILGKTVAVLGGELAPILTDVAEWLAKAASQAIAFVKANGPLIVAVLKISAAVVAAGAGLLGLGVAIYGVGAAIGVVLSLFSGVVAVFGIMTSTAGTLAIGLGVVAASFLTTTQAGAQTLSFLSGAFKDLAKVATDAFKGIGDALKAGDIKLAAQILWAAIKLEFVKGVNFLKSIWGDWSAVAIEAVKTVQTNISAGLIELWAMMKRGWAQASGTIGDVFLVTINTIKSAWGGISDWFASSWDSITASSKKALADIVANAKIGWEHIKHPFGGGAEQIKEIEAAAAKEKTEIDAGLAEKQAARERDRATAQQVSDQAILENQKETAAKIAGIDAARNEQLKALFDAANAEKAAREQARQSGLAADQKALKDAQAELDALLAKAGKGAAGAGAIPALAKGGKPGLPEEIGAIPEAVQKAKIDIAGGFQASALAGLGAGKSTQDQQLSESKKHTQLLEKLNDKAKVGQLVFS